MLSASAAYRLAIPRVHKRVNRLSAFTPDGTVLLDSIPVGGGNVVAQLSSRVSRTATFTTSDDYFPVFATDPLSPSHAIVRIDSGIGYPSGEEEVFPVFTGRIWQASRAANGQVTFRADDLAAEVIAAGFEKPVNSQFGASCVAEIQRLVLDAWQWATFGSDDVTDATVPKLTWDDDRGKACDDMAAIVGGRWYTLGDGSFVVRRNNYDLSSPLYELTDGPGGTLSAAATTVTADGAYNSVVVVSERPDNAAPIRVVERNENGLSPYRWGGFFGKKVRQIRSQSALSTAEAQILARSQLAAATALTRQWQLSCTPDATLEPGDVFAPSWRGVSDVQVIDSITYPLDASSSMTLSGRSTVDA